MSDFRQHNDPVEVVSRSDNGQSTLAVHVAHWPHLRRPAEVMWQDGSHYNYLPPTAARRFAAALVRAAEQAEQARAQEQAR